jgi:hypothetical protein
LTLAAAAPVSAQAPRPYGRLSIYVTGDQRSPKEGESSTGVETATALTFRTPEVDSRGFEAAIDLRHTRYGGVDRPQRVSLFDGFAGARLGGRGQLRLRAGHMWLSDLGTAGSLAGGLVEFRGAPAGADDRFVAGVFGGAEPMGYETGYAPGVRKYGGYAALESGFLRRHVVGFANIRQGSITQRSMLTVANYIPAGRSFFAYQALEYDIVGPADGAARAGLSYFLMNARGAAGSRVELQGTYSRGRSLDARTLSEDVLSGRPLTPQAVDGLRYETVGGRVSVKIVRSLEVYGGYARDRNNRDDEPTGRVTIGGFATDVLRTGLDVAASNARIDRPTGPYDARFVSVGRSIGRSVYASVDYSTSLAVVRFLRSDGVAIETRPWSRRVSGQMSATLNRQFSLIGVVDYTMDEGANDLRAMTGLTYRLR